MQTAVINPRAPPAGTRHIRTNTAPASKDRRISFEEFGGKIEKK